MDISRPLNLGEDKWKEYENILFKKVTFHPTYKKSLEETINNLEIEIQSEVPASDDGTGSKYIIRQSIGKYLESLCIKKGLIKKKKSKYNKFDSIEELEKYIKSKNLKLIKSKNKESVYFIDGKQKSDLIEIENSIDGIWESNFNGKWLTFIKYYSESDLYIDEDDI